MRMPDHTGRMQVGLTACIFIFRGIKLSVSRSNRRAVMRSESWLATKRQMP